MADLYSRMAALAVRQIKAKGRTITVKVKAETPSTQKPWDNGTVTYTSNSVKGLFIDPRNSEKNFDFAIKRRPDTEIERVDWHIYLPPDIGFEPKNGDIVEDGSDELKVVTCSPLKPGDTLLLYIVQVQY